MKANVLPRLAMGLLALSVAATAVAGDAIAQTEKQSLNLHAIGMFFVFVLMTLGITYWPRAAPSRPRISTPLAEASPAGRTASRSPVTTCRLRRCSASPR